MRRLLYLVPGLIVALFTLYMVFRPNGFELTFEVAGLLLVVGLALVAAVELVRRAAGRSGRHRVLLLVFAGPLLLFGAVPSWLIASGKMHFSFETTTIVFAALLIAGMAIIAYSIYLWLAQPR